MKSMRNKCVTLIFCLCCFYGSNPAAETAVPAPFLNLQGAEASNFSLQEYHGQVVMLNFWASWCGPCGQQMSHLEVLYNRYKKLGFVVLAISVDEDPRQADEFMSGLEVVIPYLYDPDGSVSELYQVETMPTTILIDRHGQQRFMDEGYQAGSEEIYNREIKKLIAD